MKKFLLSMAMVLGISAAASAVEVALPADGKQWDSYTWTADGANYKGTVEGYSLLLDKSASGSNLVAPDQYSIRVYAGAELTVTAPEGVTFTSVEVTINANGNKATEASASDGWTVSAFADGKFTMTATTPQTSITFDGAGKQLRVGSMVITASGEGTVTPDPEPTPGVEPTGEGTLASPYNVAKALEVTNALASGAQTDSEVYVKGIIASIKEVSTSYGNATYYLADVEGGETFTIFRGYWFNGDNFTSEDQLAAGAEVVVVGKLVNYMGNTPEMAQGNYVYSYNGETSGTVTPDPDPTPDPEPVEGEVIIVAKDFTLDGGDGTATKDGYTATLAKNDGATNPLFHEKTDAIRLYAQGTLTISGDDAISKIVITLASDASFRYTDFTPSTGKLEPAQEAGDTEITWVGDAKEVTFTVGDFATMGTDGDSKNGQIRFTKISIMKSSGIAEIAAEEASVEYFNLQGVRISEPAAGQVVIRRQGNKVSKIFVK